MSAEVVEHDPMFEVGYNYRMITGFGYVELPRTEPLVAGDYMVRSQEVADNMNRIYESIENT